jgi:hypothetical protein
MTNNKFSTGIFMECDNFPTNEVYVKLIGTYIEEERGSRDAYGCQIEPDYSAYFELDDIFITDYDKSVTIEEAAILFERTKSELQTLFSETLMEAYDSDIEDDSVWF